MLTPDRYLWLQANLAPEASRPDVTRVFASAPDRYIEFFTGSAIFRTPEPRANGPIGVFLPADAALYFSEDPPPDAERTSWAKPPPTEAGRHAGLVLCDGSRAALVRSPEGVPIGVSGRSRDGAAASISLDVTSAQLPGRRADNVAWALCTARILRGMPLAGGAAHAIAGGVGAPVLLSFCFSPEAGLALLALSFEDVRTVVTVDLWTPRYGGFSQVRRVASYFGAPFSQQTFNGRRPSAVVCLPLLASPIGRETERLSTLAPALADIARSAPPGNPLLRLGALDPGVEAKADYLARVRPAAARTLPALASAMADPGRPGLSDLARWLGWALVADQRSLAHAFADSFDRYEAYKAGLRAGAAPFTQRPLMSDIELDALTNQILHQLDARRLSWAGET